MSITEASLLEALKAVVDPNTGKDFVSTKQLRNLRVDGGDVAFDIELGYPAKSQVAALRRGLIAAARVVQKDDDLTIITSNGVTLRLKVKDVKQAGRATRGVHLIKPQEGDSVASVARIAAEDLKKVGAKVEGEEPPEEQPKLI